MNRIDTYRHKGMRQKLVEQIKGKGIEDERILKAIGKIPRHFFMDEAFVEKAYEDKAFPIGKGQTISQPYTVAFQTQLLRVGYGDKILEIGTGSGYQACVLAEMGANVYTIERHQSLSASAKKLLVHLGYKVRCIYGDGFMGYPPFAPYDKILITAAAPEIPKALLEQLKVGGCMVVPKDENGKQRMLRITKTNVNDYSTEPFDYFQFVPMLKGKE
ncbi:MAG: protein-L-isoaspartate(D-aspartate) O-methyltransferase [Chitinophagales bacterium]